jgi:hypothetical protein
MLAYVFWHYPRQGADAASYEASLTSLHGALRGGGIAGFRNSATYRVSRLPWLNAPGVAYEDWYLVDDWAALGVLNEAAIAGARKAPHDGAAAAYAAGAGAIYHLRAGDGDLAAAHVAHWLAKPKGMAYGEFDALLEPLVAGGASLWRRQMVLGPSPEFCLTNAGPVEFSAPLEANAMRGTALA